MESRGLIVVVDDEADLRWLICETLKDEGYDVVQFSDPRGVLTFEEAPAVFLLDLMLPGMSGIALAQTLRAERFPLVPMIAMSASGPFLSRARQSGLFQTTLPKPFDLSVLIDQVERLAVEAH